MPRILFVTAHRPNRSPSQRYRFEQYFDFLKQNGFDFDLSFLISEKDDKIFYQPGKFHTKLYFFIKSVFKRFKDVLNVSNYDIVFVHREAFMTGSTFFERRFSNSKTKLVFEFDDAIWLFDVSEANKKMGWLKNPEKTSKIIGMADLVLAGNTFLANYANQYNTNIRIIPTTIDTDKYIRSKSRGNNERVCIGWSGSMTTIKHFEYAIPFLKKLKEKYGERIQIKVMGDKNYVNRELGIQGIDWSFETEIMELSTFDIGIMPLPDDEWAKGKCGLKGLSYMALEIPTIMSPVGVNTTIIKDGHNGFLADSVDEWVDKISRLIESAELRETLGKEARKTVVERYSVHSQKENYVKFLNELLDTPTR